MTDISNGCSRDRLILAEARAPVERPTSLQLSTDPSADALRVYDENYNWMEECPPGYTAQKVGLEPSEVSRVMVALPKAIVGRPTALCVAWGHIFVPGSLDRYEHARFLFDTG